jgi:hypothetical protein
MDLLTLLKVLKLYLQKMRKYQDSIASLFLFYATIIICCHSAKGSWFLFKFLNLDMLIIVENENINKIIQNI